MPRKRAFLTVTRPGASCVVSCLFHTAREKILLEKEGSGCRVLLANDKSDDLSRMYRLFSRLPKGLEPMAEIIRDHITEACLEGGGYEMKHCGIAG